MDIPNRVFLLSSWDELEDGSTREPLGVAFTEERARAICEIQGRLAIVAHLGLADGPTPSLDWQEPNVDREVHLLHPETGLSVALYQPVVVFQDVASEI